MLKPGDVVTADTTGKVDGRNDNLSNRVVEAVTVTWVSNDSRVLEGYVQSKQGRRKKVHLCRSDLRRGAPAPCEAAPGEKDDGGH